jgi:hypothetical protein
MLDIESMDADIKPSLRGVLKVKSILSAIWREIRPIVSNNPAARGSLKLDTIHPGIYTPDSGFAHIQECVEEILGNPEEKNSYSNLIYTMQQLNSVEIIIREVLQYFKYFIRPEYKQKPDINVASQKYKDMADKRTIEEFKELLGDNSIIFRDEIETELDVDDMDDMDEMLEMPENEEDGETDDEDGQ